MQKPHPNASIGANSPNGIGRASAHQFANNGAKAVYICDYNDSHLATHQREMKSLYPNVDIHVRQFDAADEKAVMAVIDDALAKYGRLDIFFANAGIVGQPKPFTEVEGDEFMQTMKTNALGYVLPLQTCCNLLASLHSFQGFPSSQACCSSNENNLGIQAVLKWLDYLHRVGCGLAVQCWLD